MGEENGEGAVIIREKEYVVVLSVCVCVVKCAVYIAIYSNNIYIIRMDHHVDNGKDCSARNVKKMRMRQHDLWREMDGSLKGNREGSLQMTE